ncbi:MAG: Rieske 2Fe-2S domain-containing protein [Chloroflexi bacterium]|nr:Rieske 2Fe-2S domain-containing protein [Chloroflexota bacterium]
MKHPICKVEEIPDEGTKLVSLFGREFHVYKVNGIPKAVANICMHFGGQLECQAGKFVCSWHKAEFEMTEGQRLKAPAPPNSKLMFLSTRVEDGVLHYVWGE